MIKHVEGLSRAPLWGPDRMRVVGSPGAYRSNVLFTVVLVIVVKSGYVFNECCYGLMSCLCFNAYCL